jgi:hypothetical protein
MRLVVAHGGLRGVAWRSTSWHQAGLFAIYAVSEGSGAVATRRSATR